MAKKQIDLYGNKISLNKDFTLDGRITKKEKKIENCPSNGCRSGQILIKGKGFRCQICRTEFTKNKKIILNYYE